MKEHRKFNVKLFLSLHLTLLLYAGSSILSKLASGFTFLSLPFCSLYACIIILLFLYALFWQQILKRLDLNIAFANKAITVIWGIVFGKVIFQEVVTWNMVLGSLIIISGIFMVVIKHE